MIEFPFMGLCMSVAQGVCPVVLVALEMDCQQINVLCEAPFPEDDREE